MPLMTEEQWNELQRRYGISARDFILDAFDPSLIRELYGLPPVNRRMRAGRRVMTLDQWVEWARERGPHEPPVPSREPLVFGVYDGPEPLNFDPSIELCHTCCHTLLDCECEVGGNI